MIAVRNRGLTVVVVWALVTALVSAQITFSRDWSGGKRAPPQLALDCSQFTRLCRHFVHELKTAMATEGASRVSGGARGDPPIYDEEN